MSDNEHPRIDVDAGATRGGAPAHHGGAIRAVGPLGWFFRSVGVGIHMAIVEMRSHKTRSILSLLGVLLGVASLVAMLTLIGGIDVYLNKKMAKWMGTVWFNESREISEEDRPVWGRSPGMRFSDGGYMEENSPYVEGAVQRMQRWGSVVVSGSSDWARVEGLDREALEPDLENIRIGKGRWITDREYADGARVAVVSWEMDERIRRQRMESSRSESEFSVVGTEMVFRGIRFRIVGTFEPIDPDFQPWQLRRRILVPIEAMRRFVTGSDPNPGGLEIRMADVKNVKKFAAGASYAMKARHRGIEDFEYRTAEWLDTVSSMLNNASVLMSLIATMSLLVGGLSIMNVMLSSVSERIHEIGVRKALGAQNLQIFIQFIAETMTLSFLGGILGGVLGLVPLIFKEAIKKSSEGVIEATILPQHVVLVLGILTLVGIVFGLYPALRASRLDPADALRYE